MQDFDTDIKLNVSLKSDTFNLGIIVYSEHLECRVLLVKKCLYTFVDAIFRKKIWFEIENVRTNETLCWGRSIRSKILEKNLYFSVHDDKK